MNTFIEIKVTYCKYQSSSDLDSPSKKLPEDRELRHWVVVNIPANNITQGMTLTEYEPPIPSSGTGSFVTYFFIMKKVELMFCTGFHRYVFLIYEQEDNMEKEVLGNRNNWKANDFARKHNMKLVAGNYFQVNIYSYLCSVTTVIVNVLDQNGLNVGNVLAIALYN